MTATLPQEPLDDDSVFRWYAPGNGSAGLTCPICFVMVPFLIDEARGHMAWHGSLGR